MSKFSTPFLNKSPLEGAYTSGAGGMVYASNRQAFQKLQDDIVKGLGQESDPLDEIAKQRKRKTRQQERAGNVQKRLDKVKDKDSKKAKRLKTRKANLDKRVKKRKSRIDDTKKTIQERLDDKRASLDLSDFVEAAQGENKKTKNKKTENKESKFFNKDGKLKEEYQVKST